MRAVGNNNTEVMYIKCPLIRKCWQDYSKLEKVLSLSWNTNLVTNWWLTICYNTHSTEQHTTSVFLRTTYNEGYEFQLLVDTTDHVTTLTSYDTRSTRTSSQRPSPNGYLWQTDVCIPPLLQTHLPAVTRAAPVTWLPAIQYHFHITNEIISGSF
jgi:hypothetical protein